LQLEQRLNEVEQFYSTANKKQQTNRKGNSAQKDKDKEKQISGFRRRQQDAAHREAAAAKRMQELINQFDSKIICQVIAVYLHLSFQLLSVAAYSPEINFLQTANVSIHTSIVLMIATNGCLIL
jgi:hypothetical protein